MVNPNRFYTYAYLREDRTPYYIGKGQGNRAYKSGRRSVNPPKDKLRIIFLKQNITEQEAFRHEIYMIAVFGRKDLGTGILHNRTNGGDGCSGLVVSEETRNKIAEANRNRSPETIEKIRQASLNMSQEQRDKISLSNIGRKHSKEERERKSKHNKLNGIKPPINYGSWYRITFNNQEYIEIQGLRIWCECNDYRYSQVRRLSVGMIKKNKHKDIVAVEKLDTTS
jgi:hypothetical protein